MPAKTSFVTEQHLRNAALPSHGKRYTVIPHGFIIDETRRELAAAGFSIDKEMYKTSLDGQIAQGIYHLNYGNDPDMGLMFAWSNSYNKMMRFKCAIGAQVFICMNGVVSGDLVNYKRKHTGSALIDVTNSIQYQISRAKEYYDNLVADKEMLKQVSLKKNEQGSIIGRLLIDQEILTLTQVGIIQREIEKPTHSYSSNPNSAWDLYNHVTLALKDSHPLNYLSDHQKVHSFFVNEFGQLQNIYAAVEDDIQQEIPLAVDVTEEDTETVDSDFGVVFN
jgi:Domain of unknown function (DUF932)